MSVLKQCALLLLLQIRFDRLSSFSTYILSKHLHVASFTSSPKSTSIGGKKSPSSLNAIPAWNDLSSAPNFYHDQPIAINGASHTSRPATTEGTPTLYRERHGWCPYSERVWLALEAKQVDYDTVYIDNIYGRPSWYGGNTPQMQWEDGKFQSESMDLVREIDRRYDGLNGLQLYPEDILNDVVNKARDFQNIFPRARPSSRAAFLFRYDGEPLWKNEFEKVLRETDELLAETTGEGPFFCGKRFTAADVAWAPFLERYAGQLPCLHDGLNPRDAGSYPHLAAWYDAMEDLVPEYACRVRGDASSWRKVLVMAGFGNAGLPPVISSRIDDESASEGVALTQEEEDRQQAVWNKYASIRPHVAASPGEEAASVLTRNRELIAMDVAKNSGKKANEFDLPLDEEALDITMRSLACLLSGKADDDVITECKNDPHVKALASFLDYRMCVPRDMGALSAACIKRLAASL